MILSLFILDSSFLWDANLIIINFQMQLQTIVKQTAISNSFIILLLVWLITIKQGIIIS